MIFSEDMEISILYTDVINLHFLTTVLFIVHIVTFSVVYILHSAYALSSQLDDFAMLMTCALKLINSAPIHNVSFLFEFFVFINFSFCSLAKLDNAPCIIVYYSTKEVVNYQSVDSQWFVM